MPEHQQTQQSNKPDTSFQKQAIPVIQTPLSNPYSITQRARINPRSLTHADIMQLQRTIGNQAVGRLLSSIRSSSTAQQVPVQRQENPKEEEPLQGKMIETIQRQEIPEEEKPLQGKMIEPVQRQEIPEEEEPLQRMFGKEPEEEVCPSCMQRQEVPEEEKPLQGMFENNPEISCSSCSAAPIVQRQEAPEEEEPLQEKMIGTVQLQKIPEEEPLQTKTENNTGMPDNLKAGVENLSGIDMSDVRVHYNSSKPAEVGALAYTQGTDIHVAPGQERHLPHEAWHVVQQAQGRVKPTFQMKGVTVNDDEVLEHEADEMGGRVEIIQAQQKNNTGNSTVSSGTAITQKSHGLKIKVSEGNTIQCIIDPTRLNVVGENHDVSETQRSEEIEYAKGIFGKSEREECYWFEFEFKYPDDEYADPQNLRLKNHCSIIKDLLTMAWDKKSRNQPYIDVKNKASQELDKLIASDTSRLNDTEKNYITTVSATLGEILDEDWKTSQLASIYYNQAQTKLVSGLGTATTQSLAGLREQRMHEAANWGSDKKGIWKIGDEHAKALVSRRDRNYNLVLKEIFYQELKDVKIIRRQRLGNITGLDFRTSFNLDPGKDKDKEQNEEAHFRQERINRFCLL